MSYYCTLNDARGAIKAQGTADDDLVLGYIRAVSHRVDMLLDMRARPYFEPFIEARELILDGESINSAINALYLSEPLLDVSAITRNGTALSYGSTVVAYPSARRPITTLRIPDYSTNWYGCESTYDYPEPIVEVTGTWGYHNDYTRAWRSVTTLAADVTTTMTLTAVSGTGYSELYPVSAGALLKIDSEFVRVLAVNTSTKVITVARGENGSTAEQHTSAAAVYVWDWPQDVRTEVTRQVGLLYTRRGSYDAIAQNEIGVINQYPQDLLVSLRNVVSQYMVG